MNHRRKPLGLFLAVTLACLSLTPSPASASATYFTTAGVLKEFFPNSERVTYRKIPLTREKREILTKRLGYQPKLSEYVVFVALTGDRVDGYAVIDDERGQHEPITFAVKFSPQGVVERQEVMVYREKYGEEIVDSRFRVQFVGKTGNDPLRAGRDIDVVTGATISSRSMAVGVRRAIALVEELVIKPEAVVREGSGQENESKG